MIALWGAVLLAAGAAPAEAPVEYTLSLQQDDWRVRATVRPGQPQPGRLVEIVFDVGRQTATETAALEGGKLALSVSGPGTKTRHVLHALGDAGIYGVHWTPSAKGLWTLALAPYAGEGPSVSFQLGVGVPMPASAQGHAVQASRVVVAAGRAEQEGASAKQLMAELGQRWLRALEPGADAAAEAAAMAPLLQRLHGRAPRDWAKDSAEYDALAQDLAASLEKAAALKAKAADALRPLEQSSCLKCHLKFRDGLVADLSTWPEVKPWKR